MSEFCTDIYIGDDCQMRYFMLASSPDTRMSIMELLACFEFTCGNMGSSSFQLPMSTAASHLNIASANSTLYISTAQWQINRFVFQCMNRTGICLISLISIWCIELWSSVASYFSRLEFDLMA
ncbi:hypothetical protein Ancab_032089 [Ancistrocladus abbreviatus]